MLMQEEVKKSEGNAQREPEQLIMPLFKESETDADVTKKENETGGKNMYIGNNNEREFSLKA